MTQIVHRSCVFFVLYFAWKTACICRTPHMNLCGYSEDKSNSTGTGDKFEGVCDCEQMIFCYVIEISQNCSAPLILLHANNKTAGQFHCDVISLLSKEVAADYEILNKTEDEFGLKIFTPSEFGWFKIICNEVLNEYNAFDSGQLEIVSISPSEVSVDSESKLQLTVSKKNGTNGTWCFVKTPDNNLDILLATWVSDTQIDCLGFSPKTPNLYKISLGSTITPSTFDKSGVVKVTSKRPVAQGAEYNSDSEIIIIHFDRNIELHSSCIGVFAQSIQQQIGQCSECSVRGNLLMVKPGLQFQSVENIMISPDNKICQAGSGDGEFCLPAHPANLVVFKPKLPGPSVSLQMKSGCSGNEPQKYVVKVSPYKGSKNSATSRQTLNMKSAGKVQRRNLMNWRKMREFQSKIPGRVNLEMSVTDILPILENAQSLESVFQFGDVSGTAANVSVVVQSSATTSSILAEAEVTLCEDSIKLFQYKWLVDGKEVYGDGKQLIMKDLTSGKHVIKCLVVALNSSEILGQGWSTAEVLDYEKKVFVTPFEITVGTEDDISLQAVGWENSLSWNCGTTNGEVCFTIKNEKVSDIIDLKSSKVTIPAGTLPTGGYVWTVNKAGGSNTAKVFVKSGNVPIVGVARPSVFVKPEEFVLAGTVSKARVGCRAWWSSVRETGFDYLHLNTSVEFSLGEKQPTENISQPISSELWKDVQPNSRYVFKLQVFCPQSSESQERSYDYLKLPIVIKKPPKLSPLIVEPREGEAMITEFSISGGEPDVPIEDQPLTFEWSYLDTCDKEVVMSRAAFGRSFKTYLPPGDLQVIARVCDRSDICSTVSSSRIDVIQASEFPAKNFQNARIRIERLMASGDIFEAFGLAVTVFKSLALVVETEVREKIFSTVEAGIKTKMEDLTRRMQSDPKVRELSLEFCERAAQVAKYFRKDSDILSLITDLKNRTNSVKP